MRGMAEHSFSIVYNYQCLMWILTFPLIPLPSYLLFIFEKNKVTNCNLQENKNCQFLTGFYAKSSIRRQHYENIKRCSLSFLTQTKIGNWQKNGQADVFMLWYFGEKKGLCIGMAMLPFQKEWLIFLTQKFVAAVKKLFLNITTDYCDCLVEKWRQQDKGLC